MKQTAHVAQLIGRIGIDANAANELLSFAAELLESGKPLPNQLAQFLAASIRRAMAEPSANRANALVFELGLTAPAKQGRPRKPTPDGEIAATIAIFGGGKHDTEIKRELKRAYGLSGNTARSRIRAAAEKIAEAKAQMKLTKRT